jgi:hypothetical protein
VQVLTCSVLYTFTPPCCMCMYLYTNTLNGRCFVCIHRIGPSHLLLLHNRQSKSGREKERGGHLSITYAYSHTRSRRPRPDHSLTLISLRPNRLSTYIHKYKSTITHTHTQREKGVLGISRRLFADIEAIKDYLALRHKKTYYIYIEWNPGPVSITLR